MALTDLALSLLVFPQEWDGAQLGMNLLVLPSRNPLAPLSPTGPQFAGTTYQLQIVVVPDIESPPVDNDPLAKLTPFTAVPAAAALTIWQKLADALNIVSRPLKPLASVSIRKSLPESYTSAFQFDGPRTDRAVLGDEFACSVRAKDPGVNAPPPANELTWGEVISFALRSPKVARTVGLVYEKIFIALDPADLAAGAWVFARFDPSANPYAAGLALQPDLLQTFAARIPPISGPRTLFAPVLFPVGAAATNPLVYDAANREVQEYDDGFARIVHCHQPRSADVATETANELTPATDAGIQLGWDDEQVVIWQNRQLDGARAATPNNVALGVLGYRVDMRREHEADWTSLCTSSYDLVVDPSIDGPYDLEAPVEPVPTRALGADNSAWLPRYFAQWRGKSLVVRDEVPYLLTGGALPLAATRLTSLVPPNLLHYGETYQFRTRLVDLTHGGPEASKEPLNPAPASIGECTFRRFVKPRTARTEILPDPDARTIDEVRVWRPILGYPELLYAGVPDAAVPTLLAQVAQAKADNRILGANDPDVHALRIIVEARTPAHDTTDSETLDDGYRELYRLDTSFPPLAADPIAPLAPSLGDAIRLQLDYQDVATISDLAAPAPANPQVLPIPRARDVRIRLVPLASHPNPDYFGVPTDDASDPRQGMPTNLATRSDAGQEAGVLDPDLEPVDMLAAILLQPGEDVPERLAQALGLDVIGLTFSGKPGQRVAFGASGRFRLTLSGDHGALTFATQSELLDRWVIALTPRLDRDWTWDGLADEGVVVRRDGATIGAVRVPRTAGGAAVAPSSSPDAPQRREGTRLVFFDAIDPHPPAGQFPTAPAHTWTLTPSLRTGLATPDGPTELTVTLPKASPPVQTPRIASAGVALSPYLPADDYSSTEQRRRALWIEFEEGVADPADGYFARVVAYGLDPLLTGDLLTHEIPEPPLPIAPEPIRIITPGQTADLAGLEAMTELIPSFDPANPTAKPRHFLLPLPPGVTEDSPELFGFWTYELRVGHRGTGLANWSTAQARFGRPLRATGVQHPAPPLKCVVSRRSDEIHVVAPFATPILDGRTNFGGGPETELWVLLYAQVTRADGDVRRNVLLASRRSQAMRRVEGEFLLVPSVGGGRDRLGLATFSMANAALDDGVAQTLADHSLPLDSPLSVLAVELLPSNGDFDDPLGTDLGSQRILRASPLTPVPMVC